MSDPVATVLTIRPPRFTPGLWSRNINSKYPIYAGAAPNHCFIANVTGPGHACEAEREANYRLVTAAPEMYDLISELAYSGRALNDLIDEARQLVKALDL